ncbi:hypothetical protein [Burkholderia sp. Bp8963]|uniref:hypothetical protein n=1 Tax=Burkholderia sp. Bp8963 TaxID=2184547 RepID=UPI001639CCDC|nr:hypothetical protein [Burkholderia sp. Bp8963]
MALKQAASNLCEKLSMDSIPMTRRIGQSPPLIGSTFAPNSPLRSGPQFLNKCSTTGCYVELYIQTATRQESNCLDFMRVHQEARLRSNFTHDQRQTGCDRAMANSGCGRS